MTIILLSQLKQHLFFEINNKNALSAGHVRPAWKYVKGNDSFSAILYLLCKCPSYEKRYYRIMSRRIPHPNVGWENVVYKFLCAGWCKVNPFPYISIFRNSSCGSFRTTPLMANDTRRATTSFLLQQRLGLPFAAISSFVLITVLKMECSKNYRDKKATFRPFNGHYQAKWR